ncbi:MAG: BON domain-containing protein [Fuerstiella sp.]|nr:BON domain-containing protein [Fuerstiella sp.]
MVLSEGWIPVQTRQLFLHVTFSAALLFSAEAMAQLGQIGGGGQTATGGGNAAAQGSATEGGGTTEGAGGRTTQGLDGGGQDGGVAGGNTRETFIGSNQTGNFVGGAVATDTGANRLFRALAEASVPTGGNQQTGTPRSIPTSLRIAFSYPSPNAGSGLAPASGYAINRVALQRPEFRNVSVSVSSVGVAVLDGAVNNAAARRLAANLIRLRPGVRKVENRILIAAE